MASKPRRKSLRDRIWAIFGIRPKRRVISLFTEDLPQDHMQWMEQPQYLSYVQSLESHLQPDSTPPTSNESKEHSQLANNASSSTTNNLPQSSSFLSLDHWTSTAISPLELFYCATVAPYDVRHPLKNQVFFKERPGRASSNRRKDGAAFPVRNTKSDLDCSSRFAAASSRMAFLDFPDEKPPSRQDLFLESGENFVRRSVNNTKRKAGENYKVPIKKERLHGLRQESKENLYDLRDTETGNTMKSEKHKGTSAKNGSKARNERRQDSDVTIRLGDNKVALTIKKLCKNIVIRCENTTQCKETPTDSSNRVRINLRKLEEVVRPNKDKVTVNIVGDCTILTVHTGTEEISPNDSSQNGSYLKSSNDCKASGISNDKCTDQGLNKIKEGMYPSCQSTSIEVQTDIIGLEGTRSIPIVLAPSHALTAAENSTGVTENGDISLKQSCLEKADVDQQDTNACTSRRSIDGEAKAKMSLDSPHAESCNQFEDVIVNPNEKPNDAVVIEDTGGSSERSSEVVTGGCEDKVDILQCCVRVPPEGASADDTTDDSGLYVAGNEDVIKLEGPTVSVSHDSNIDPGTSCLRGNQEETGIIGCHFRLNDDADKKVDIIKDLGGENNICFIDETGLVDVFLLMKIQHRNNSFGMQEESGFSGQYRSIGRLQHQLQQVDNELEECRRQLAQVNRCVTALRQEVTSVRRALTAVCHLTATCNGESSWLRTLEPACYKKFLHIHTRVEAKHTRELVRNHIKALNDLEVLIYRKHLVLLQVLPCLQADPIHQSKRGGISTHKAQKSKRKEQTENNPEPTSSVIIEIVSVPTETYSSVETSSGGSPANISTLMSTCSDGGASSQYFTDTEI